MTEPTRKRPPWLNGAIRGMWTNRRPDWLKEAMGAQLSEVEKNQTQARPIPTRDEVVSQTVDQIASDILKREGGFVNDPDDPGGATNFGVTLGTMKDLGLDLNKDGTVTEADVKLMTFDKAKKLFIDEYYKKPGIDKLPPELQASVFDMQVNSGGNAVRILQRTASKFGETQIADDGILGPQTYKAVATLYNQMGSELVNEYGVARRDYYYGLGDNRPQSRKYATRVDGGKGGWIKRAEEFMSPDYQLTNEQHQERVAPWAG